MMQVRNEGNKRPVGTESRGRDGETPAQREERNGERGEKSVGYRTEEGVSLQLFRVLSITSVYA